MALLTCDNLDGHVTCCAGIACGNLHISKVDGLPVKCCGVAPNANLMIWKAYDYAQKIPIDTPIDTWLKRLEDMASYCAHDDVHVDVVVISSGFEQPNKRMKDAIKKLDSKGVIAVCAAGNDGAKDINNIKYPELYPQTICVGAHDRNGYPFFISWKCNRYFCTRRKYCWSKLCGYNAGRFKLLQVFETR